MEMVWLVVASILSGAIAGMGMGGGTILIPVLIIFFNTQQQVAQSLNLLAFLPAAIISLVIHIKNKLVNYKLAFWFIGAGVFASLFGSVLAVSLQSEVLQKLFGCFLLLIGAYQLYCSIIAFIKRKKNKVKPEIKVAIFTSKMFK